MSRSAARADDSSGWWKAGPGPSPGRGGGVGKRGRLGCRRWRGASFGGRATCGVQMPQRQPVGGGQGGLGIGDPALVAELADQGLGATQVRPGHAREEVVLDLVVQPTEDEVDEPAAADVAGGEHLPAQVVQLVVRAQQVCPPQKPANMRERPGRSTLAAHRQDRVMAGCRGRPCHDHPQCPDIALHTGASATDRRQSRASVRAAA
jgi:hypothetical protein